MKIQCKIVLIVVKGVCGALSFIYHGVFFENSWRLLLLTIFVKDIIIDVWQVLKTSLRDEFI